MSPEPTPPRWRRALPALARLGAVLCVLALAAVAVRVAFKDQLHPRQALDLLHRVQAQGWALPAFAALYVTLTTALAPAVVFHLVAGAAWGFPLGLALNLTLFNATASLHFWIARRLGRQRVRALLDLLGLGGWEARVSGIGLRGAVALRVLPFPTLVASAIAGVSPMRWSHFALGTLLGAIPWISIYTYFAASVVAGVEGAERRSFIQAAAASVVILAVTVLPRLVRRRRGPNLP